MKLDIKALLVFAVLAGALGFFLFSPNGAQSAPELKAQTIDGRPIDTADLKGTPYMVVFWATDCPGCVKEIPHLVELYDEMNTKGLEIIGVAMPHDNVSAIKTMRQQRDMRWDLVFDETGTISKEFGGVKVTPTSFLVGPDGRIALQKMGELDMPALRQRILDMLKS
ncbi:MAG: TlpA family protein disulfide reductase [Thiothrix sp.]|nr:TlpA family protein disulfide reductase [Thiothrix sp.]HPQ94159.1 TlpA disulfide reductase family protein [Thiolinea sp.]